MIALPPDESARRTRQIQRLAERAGRGGGHRARLAAAWPECEIALAPIADGGEGFAESLPAGAAGGEWVELTRAGSARPPMAARYAWVAEQRLAVLEMSEASGLWRLTAEERAPLHANTFRHGAAHARTRRSAARGRSSSGSAAAPPPMAAPAWPPRSATVFSARGRRSPAPLTGLRCAIEREGAAPAAGDRRRVRCARIRCSARAARRGSSLRKRARTPAAVEELEQRVRDWLRWCGAISGAIIAMRRAPARRAASALGCSLFAAPRCARVSTWSKRRSACARCWPACDLVITGEGRLDAQTLDGKGPAGVAALARKPRASRCSRSPAPSVREAESSFDAACPIIDAPVALRDAMADAAAFLERAAGRAARLVRLGYRLS